MKLKLLVAAALASLSIEAALAQTSPNLTQGQKLTPAQWNALFSGKQDVLGYVPLNTTGGVLTGRLVTAPPGASTAGLNLTPGTAPGLPVNGDLWFTSAGLFARVGGVSIGPIGGFPAAPTISSGCGGGSPSISAPRGPAAFRVTIGTASGSTCVLNLPTAANGWNCVAFNQTTITTASFLVKQSASSTTQVTLTNYNTSAAAATWVAADVLGVNCTPF